MSDLGDFFCTEDEDAQHVAKRNGAAHHPEALLSVDPAGLADVPVPARQWLVPDWVPIARATGLYGAGGEGKTLLAQMLATAGAVGVPWLGLPVLRCRSVLLMCEDDLDEMHRRQEAINASFGCSFTDLGAMRWLPRLGEDNALMTFGDRPTITPLFDQLAFEAKAHGARLVITDTLADIFSGNENDRAQARAFAQQVLGRLAREINGAVLALAHPSRAGMNSGSGESGSTAWVGAFRSQLYLATPKAEQGEPADPDARVLTRRKSNAARRDETIELRWHDGVFEALGPADGIIGAIERRTASRVFLDLLDKVTAENQPVSSSSRASNFAPKLFSQRPAPEREHFGKADFERAMQVAFADGEITNAPYGRRGDERYRIARTGNPT